MKIRHKATGIVLEGEFKRAANYTFVQESCDGGCSVSRYAAEHWEEVHDWQDVTADCKFYDGRMWHAPALSIATLLPSNGYRVRQVSVSFTGKGIQNGCQPGYAFIVEKQIQ